MKSLGVCVSHVLFERKQFVRLCDRSPWISLSDGVLQHSIILDTPSSADRLCSILSLVVQPTRVLRIDKLFFCAVDQWMSNVQIRFLGCVERTHRVMKCRVHMHSRHQLQIELFEEERETNTGTEISQRGEVSGERKLDCWLLTLIRNLDRSIIQCFYSNELANTKIIRSTGILRCEFELTPSLPASAPLPPEITIGGSEPPRCPW